MRFSRRWTTVSATVVCCTVLLFCLSGCQPGEGRIKAVFESENWQKTFCVEVRRTNLGYYEFDETTSAPLYRSPDGSWQQKWEEMEGDVHLTYEFPPPLPFNGEYFIQVRDIHISIRAGGGTSKTGVSQAEESFRQGEVFVTWSEDGHERREVLQLVEYSRNPLGAFSCRGF